jgi:opacity protein-like surface antigen
MKRLAVFTGALAVTFLLSSNAQAELYVGGELGYSIPNDFTDVTGRGPISGCCASDLVLKNSFMYGARIGYFIPDQWLGFEVEGFSTTPHVKQQDVTLGGVTFPGVPGTHVRVTTLAFNVVARAKLRPLQPYVGIGPGVFFVRASNAFGIPGNSSSDTAVGLNAFVGARYFFNEQVAMFAEYKYNRASFSFAADGIAPGERVDGTSSVNILTAGVVYHFR